MKVLHLCLSAVFVENRAYQENELVAEHHRQGHEVLVIANTDVHGADGGITTTSPGQYEACEGVQLIRLPFHPLLPHALARRLRIHQNVYRMIEDFGPDVILFHNMSGWELRTVARYARDHPDVLFYVDNHADFVNSGRSFMSRWGLHYLFYRPILRRALPQIRKVLCISLLTQEFARKLYGVPDDKLEFFPLGGRPIHDPEYSERRSRVRTELGLSEDSILFVQSGRQFALKKLPEVLRALSRIKEDRFRYVIAGVLMDDIREEAQKLIAADDRVIFKDWISPAQLEDYLCAADVYSQPGQQSVTMQTSMCCRCAVLLQDWESHRTYVMGNGWLVQDEAEIECVLRDISEGKVDLKRMQSQSYLRACEILDYSVLAQRVLN